MLVLFQGDHRHARGVAGLLFGNLGGVGQQHAAAAGAHGQLGLLGQLHHAGQLLLVAVSLEQLFPVLFGGVAVHGNLGKLAVGVGKQHVAAVIQRDRHIHRLLALVHAKACRHKFAHDAGLGVGKICRPALVHLTLVGEEQQPGVVAGLDLLHHLVAFLEFLLAAHAQRLGRDLLEVALPGEEHGNRIIRQALLLGGRICGLHVVQNRAAAGLAVFFCHRVQLFDDDPSDLGLGFEDLLQAGNLRLQIRNLLGALEDVFPVQVAQLDLRHIFRLGLVDAEADHQIGHYLGVLLGLAHDADGLVDVQQDGLQALQKVQTLLLALQIVVGAAAHAFHPEGHPLVQNLPYAQHAGLAADEQVKVAGKAVLQLSGAEQFLHQLVRVLTTFQVNGQLQTVQIGLIAHVADFLDLAGLDQLGNLVHHRLHRSGGRDTGDLQHVAVLFITVLGAHPHAAAAGLVDLAQLGLVVKNLTAAHKVRRRQGGEQVVVRVAHQSHSSFAQLRQIEGTDVGGHAHSNTQRVVGQNGGEGHRQQGRLGGGAVVIGHKIHGILVDVPEQLLTHRFQLGLGVTAGGVGHVPAVCLAKVSLGIHKRHQQAFVAPAHTHHGFINGRVAVGVQVHGAAHDVSALGARTL